MIASFNSQNGILSLQSDGTEGSDQQLSEFLAYISKRHLKLQENGSVDADLSVIQGYAGTPNVPVSAHSS